MNVRLMMDSAGAAGNFLAPMDQISANAMKSVIDIDVLGSWNTVKATLPYLIESAKKYPTIGGIEPVNGTGGRIIFVSATLHYGGTPLQSHVSVAKAGVDAMAMSVAIEQGPRGVTSNVIAPGPIADTEGVARLSRSDTRENSAKTIPSGRYGTVKEIADATVYLFSDSGNYVNGEVLVGESALNGLLRLGLLLTSSSQLMAASGIQQVCRLRAHLHTPSFCSQEMPFKVLQAARNRSCKFATQTSPLLQVHRNTRYYFSLALPHSDVYQRPADYGTV
jgi:NADP-dependent 3-hydroxy acid dehydrogenase YdfG